MKKFLSVFALVALLGLLPASALAQLGNPDEELPTEKRAQSGFKFLQMSYDARGAAMADAMTAEETNSAVSMFYNPAGMARMTSFINVMGGQTQWIADIRHNVAAVALAPMGGQYGVIGFQVASVDYGEIIATMRADNEAGYIDYAELNLKDPSPTAFVLGATYARALSDRFSVGFTAKYARQSLGSALLDASLNDAGTGIDSDFEEEKNDLSAMVYDFGVLYKTGFRSLNFAMSARNFAQELKYVDDQFETPLAFRIGVSMDLIDLTSLDRNMHSFRVALDAERPRDFDEQIKIGGEYTIFNTLSLRAGYTMPTDVQGVNLGVGLKRQLSSTMGFSADFSYSQMEIFDDVSRIALSLSF